MAPMAPLPRRTGWDMTYLLRTLLHRDYPFRLKSTRLPRRRPGADRVPLRRIYVHMLATGRVYPAHFRLRPFIRDEVPLAWCCGPGVRLDFPFAPRLRYRGRRPAGANRGDRSRARPRVIVLLWTGVDQFIDDDDRYCSVRAGCPSRA